MTSFNINEVIIVGKQWRLRALARAQLIEEGYDILAFEEIDVLAASIKDRTSKPLLIILDLWGFALNKHLIESLNQLSKTQRLLLCLGAQDEFDLDLPGSIIVFRRPFSIGDLIKKVKEIRSKTLLD